MFAKSLAQIQLTSTVPLSELYQIFDMLVDWIG